MNVRVNLNCPIYDGAEIVFKAPCDASEVTGLIVYYPGDAGVVSSEFAFADAHANNLYNIDALFKAGAVVKVIIDTDTNMAFVQNAVTNAYLEEKFAGIGGGGSAEGAVLYTKQELTPEQQAQARANIGAAQKTAYGIIIQGVNEQAEIEVFDLADDSGQLHTTLRMLGYEDGFVRLRGIIDGVEDFDAATVGQLNTAVGGISAALDELHAYAEALKGGESV